MPIRVTPGMMHSQLLRNVSNNVIRMSEHQLQLTTTRKINKPSDDPVGITYSLRYRSEISMNEQYRRNIDSAKSYIEHTDTVLNQINEVIQRVNELATKGLNGTNPPEALKAIGSEIGSLYEELVAVGNDQFNGNYIFNGQMVNTKPYTLGGAPGESTDDKKIVYQFTAGVTLEVSFSGNEVFGHGTDTDNLFAVVKGLAEAFNNGQQATAEAQYDNLKQRLDKFLTVRSEVGARANRIELMEERLKDLSVNLEGLIGKTEGADMAEVITRLKIDESVYQASLSVGARMIQPSLLDYIR